MRDLAGTRAFLEGEVAALEAFDFVTVEPSGQPLHRVEIGRTEEQGLEVRVPGRMPMLPALEADEQAALTEMGFVNEQASDPMQPWVRPVDDANNAISTMEQIFEKVFDEKPGAALDIMHGNHRAVHEAQVKLAAVRERVERVISETIERKPDQDADGDFVLEIGEVRVTVAPRVVPGGPAIVRVFAITNVGIAVVPELGIFLSRLNFGLMFGRFSLDAENKSIWFDETLLGDQLNEEALKFAIHVVSTTADEWDDRIKQMFGGLKHREAKEGEAAQDASRAKPGEGRGDGQGLYL